MGCSASAAPPPRELKSSELPVKLGRGEIRLRIESLLEDFEPMVVVAHKRAEVRWIAELLEKERGIPLRQQVLSLGSGASGDRLKVWKGNRIGDAVKAQTDGLIVLRVVEPPPRPLFKIAGKAAVISGEHSTVTTHVADAVAPRRAAAAAASTARPTWDAPRGRPSAGAPAGRSPSRLSVEAPGLERLSPRTSPRGSPQTSPRGSPMNSPCSGGDFSAKSSRRSDGSDSEDFDPAFGAPAKPSLSLTNVVADDTTGPVYAELRVLSGREKDGAVCSFIGAIVMKPDLRLNGWHNSSSNMEAYFLDMRKGGPIGQGDWTEPNEGGGFNSFKVGDTLGVLVRVGPEGFVRFFKNGKKWGGNFKATPKRPIKSPLVIVVHSMDKGLSYELLPDATAPAGF